MPYCAKVGVEAASYHIDKPYTYLVPEELAEKVQVGMRVLVPFGRGNRSSEGLVLSLGEEEKQPRLKGILALLDEKPVLNKEGMQLALWLRERYFTTIYFAAMSMLPTGLWYVLKDRYTIALDVSKDMAYEKAGSSKYAKKVLDMLYASDGSGEFSHIIASLDLVNPRALLKRMVSQGVLVMETGAQRKIKDKTEKIASLAMAPQEALTLVEKRKTSAPVSYAAVSLLTGLGSASVKEISYFTGATLGTMKSLEKKGIVSLSEREVFRRVSPEFTKDVPEIHLNKAQERAYEGLSQVAESEKGEVALLYGVTGSGKTQVYLKLITDMVNRGKSALVLVPEIALTAKLLELFSLHFREKVAILHSGLPATERFDEWKRIRDGKATVVLGTRSAVFAPLENLGVIILDEEHEPSYQSDTMLRYHGRDVAKYRAFKEKSLLVLGSATPSIETMSAAETGLYHRFDLRHRFNEKAMPKVLLADMKVELKLGNHSGFSEILWEELDKNIKNGEQSILFLNRRGTSNTLICGECGVAPECPKCTVNLVYHEANRRLMCHYCGHGEPAPQYCPHCGGLLFPVGMGTQKVEGELKKRYPDVPVMRMDADTVTAKRSHEVILEEFVRKKIPILVGTQMVAKGLDFPNVTLVGVLDADAALYAQNFRASERSFSLITQVVGRAGRGSKEGRAVIQTMSPDNEIITLAAAQDYDGFYDLEKSVRAVRHFPPFGDVFRISLSGLEEKTVLQMAEKIRDSVALWTRARGGREVKVFGPATAGIRKLNNRYRYYLHFQEENTKETRAWIGELLRMAQKDPQSRGVVITADCNLGD